MSYVLNRTRKVAHVEPTMERCNADQLKERGRSETLPEGYRLCGWCAAREAQ